MCQHELTEFFPELTEFAAELSEFSLPKQYSRNSIPPVSYNFSTGNIADFCNYVLPSQQGQFNYEGYQIRCMSSCWPTTG